MLDRPRVASGAAGSAAAHAELAPLYEHRGLLREASTELRDLTRYRELVGYMVTSSLKVETARTVLGAIWWLLDPILLSLVFVLFVDVILNRGGDDYALFVLIGMIAWKQFSSGTGRAMGNTVSHQELMKQVRFPRTVLPLAAVLAVTVHFAVGLLVMIGAATFFGSYPRPALVLLPVVAAIQVTFTLGLSFAFAGANFYLRDLQAMIAYVIQAWFFLSPVLYPRSDVPENLDWLYTYNPFTYLLDGYRSIVMDGDVPDFGPLGIVAAVSIALVVLGYLAFVRLQRSFTKVS